MLSRANERIFQIVASILLLVDGTIHLSLDWVLFRGNLFGSLAAPGRAAPRNPLLVPTNILFVLYFVGAVGLVVLFWVVRLRLAERRWWMNVVMMVYAAMAFGAWLTYGMPNPLGLGYLSKTIEVVLIIVLFVYAWLIVRTRRPVAA